MMKKLFFTALLVSGPAFAGNPSADLVVNVVPAGASGVATMLPTPPIGYHWVQTFGDEFSTTSSNSGTATAPVTLNTSTWTVDHFCPNNFPGNYNPPYYGCTASGENSNDTVDSGTGILSMALDNSTFNGPARNIINTPNSFVQRFGFFVYRCKMPPNNAGELSSTEIDLESFAKDSGVGGAYGELAWQQFFAPNVNPLTQYNIYVIEGSTGQVGLGSPNVGVDLSADYHQYGLLWSNDGTAHGSVSGYFDGNLVSNSPYALHDAVWDSGLYFDIYYSFFINPNQVTGPMQFDWVRAYQLAPN
jgi:hypothetical protein